MEESTEYLSEKLKTGRPERTQETGTRKKLLIDNNTAEKMEGEQPTMYNVLHMQRS
jgi:hypothetical protein